MPADRRRGSEQDARLCRIASGLPGPLAGQYERSIGKGGDPVRRMCHGMWVSRSLVRPNPPLQKDRVALRPFETSDAPAISRACQDDAIPKFTFMPQNMTVEQAERWIQHRAERWPEGLASFAITLPDDDELLGQIGIFFEWQFNRAEAFYWLSSSARGRGMATAALELVTSWAFDTYAMVRVQLITHLENVASQAVAQRCGFTLEGTLRAWEPIKDAQPDVLMWSRLISD